MRKALFYISNEIRLTTKHAVKPIAVGSAIENNVHLRLFVSFHTVKTVVEHGKWNKENKMVHNAVVIVQPFSTKSVCNVESSEISVRLPSDRYVMIIMGVTISFAGKPRTKPSRIVPSIPNQFANGSRKAEMWWRSGTFSTVRFPRSQMSIPVGAATMQALPSTNRVLSNTERTMTLPICGFR